MSRVSVINVDIEGVRDKGYMGPKVRLKMMGLMPPVPSQRI